MYFTNCTTIDQAKNLFRDLCKELHPDTSGYDSQADFIKMYADFKKFRPTVTKENEAEFNADKFYDLLKRFDVLHDIKVSFVGSFIWLEDIERGATFNQKETIKKILLEGYNYVKFASKKKSWYFSPLEYVQKSKVRVSLDTIKSRYGCDSFKVNHRLQLS
jgi:hypothetical protein